MDSNLDLAVIGRNIKKSFTSGGTVTHALRGIDLDIRRGELFMLVGPSGCGKTTLISVIACILHFSEGTLSVLGQDLKAMDDDQSIRFRSKKIGFVFQAYNLIPQLTAAENVSIPLLLHSVPKAQALSKAERVLESVGLGSKVNSLPTELSGGQQQRVAIARALIHEPELIVCDEPTSALDHTTGEEVMKLLREQCKVRKCTLIIVTHDQRIYGFADRIGMMDDGMIQKIVVPQELR